MIHVVDQRAAGLWQVTGLKPTNDGTLLRPAAPDLGLTEPYAASPAGPTMAVADAGHDRIALVDLASGDTTSVDLAGSAVGPLKGPRGVTVTDAGTLVVADTGNRRIVWSASTVEEIVADGGAAEGWTAYGQASADGSRGPGDFLAPTSVCTDADGRTWVSDPGLGRVAVVEGAGGWSEVTLPPRAEGGQRLPYALARAGADVLVTDLASGEIWQVDSDLTSSLVVAGRTKGRLTAPVAICAEARGFVVADAVGARIVRWSRDRAGKLRYRGELAARGRPPGAPTFSRLTGLAVTGGER